MDKAALPAPSAWSKRKFLLGIFLVLQLAVLTVVFVMPNEELNQPQMPRNASAGIKAQQDVHFGHSLLDIHHEDFTSGHASNSTVQIDSPLNATLSPGKNASTIISLDLTAIAVGMGLTTRGTKLLNLDNLEKTMPFFQNLLPSFCQTCSSGFNYHFFIAYDFNDPFLNDVKFLKTFHQVFHFFTQAKCTNGSTYSLHFVKCNHTRHPAWAQNDAMMEAYYSNMAYFYRINDDTKMVTPGWTEVFIKTLSEMDPPGVGVVGPAHSGGNTRILTYDFVSHYHVDIFGFYYPRNFLDWSADGWVTDVYKPDRSKKLASMKLAHLMSLGQRYVAHRIKGDTMTKQLAKDKTTLSRYIDSLRSSKEQSSRYIVSLALSGNKSVNTYGAVWYAQHIRSYLPDWTLRVYIDNTTQDHQVPSAILQKLAYLGAQIAIIPVKMANYPSSSWRHLVVSDGDVDAFLIRDVTSRFTERESVILDAWITNMTNNPVYCVRDHPDHAALPIIDGLWGANNRHLRDLHINLTQIFFSEDVTGTTAVNSQDILKNKLWPLIKDISGCFDSVSCQAWSGSIPYPVLREEDEWVGRMYNQYGVANQSQSVALGMKPNSCNKHQP